MDENHYRQTYKQINGQRCVFEKSLQTQISACSQSHRFCLADREGVACNHDLGHKRCSALLELLRSNANFALGLPKIDTALPHNKEVRIQNGGLLGILSLTTNKPVNDQKIEDIHGLITHIIEDFQSIEALPFDKVVKFIVSYEVKKRRRSS